MADSLINWKKQDYLRLGRAVSRFNKIIKEAGGEDKFYFPELKNYNEIKSNILTRRELKNTLRSLESLKPEDLAKTRQFGNTIITEYEYKDIRKRRTSAIRQLNRELLEEQESLRTGNRLFNPRINEIEESIKSLKTLEDKSGYMFENIKDRIMLYSNSYEMRSAIRFQDFHKNQLLPSLSGISGTEEIVKYLDKYKNPISYYNVINRSETLKTMMLFWDSETGTFDLDGFLSSTNYDSEEEAIETIKSEIGMYG